MSESETPMNQNTTGGEPLPNDETDNEVTQLGNERVVVEDDVDDDDGEDEEEENDSGEDDDEEDEEDFMDELPKAVRHRVEFMKQLNEKRDKIMEGYLAERAALEKKYSDLCKPLYEERAKIIVGEKDEDIAEFVRSKENDGVEKDVNDDAENKSDGVVDEEDENLVGVPEFWSCCVHNIEAISELVTERDNECLLHLENVTCDDFEDGKGFELSFYFKENPFFLNKCLTKRCK